MHRDLVQDLEQCHNIMAQEGSTKFIEYDSVIAGVAARFIHDANHGAMTDGQSFAQQLILQKGIKKWGDRGKAAAKKEMAQLHDH
jgi:hypothetical protein